MTKPVGRQNAFSEAWNKNMQEVQNQALMQQYLNNLKEAGWIKDETLDLRTGSKDNPIRLRDVTVTTKKPKRSSAQNLKDNLYDATTFNRNNQRVKMYQDYPDVTNYVQEGGDMAGKAVMAMGAFPVATQFAVETAAPFIAENMPYLSARHWVTQGANPSWLTPKIATAIDATMMGAPTGASMYNMYQNGPTFENVLGTTLGLGGLAFESMPLAVDLYQGGKRAYNTYQLGRNLEKSTRNWNGTNEALPLNVGWGPRQTVSVTRAQTTSDPILNFYPERWDVINEGANPLGAWFQGKLGIPRTVETGSTLEKANKAGRARNLFTTRPIQLKGDLTLEKPLVTVGDVPNRSTLSYQAEQMGADGIIYNGVYDNGYDANQVILSFNPESFNNTSRRFGHGTLSFAELLGIPKVERNNQVLKLSSDRFYHQAANIASEFNPPREHDRWFSKGKLFYDNQDDVIELLNPNKVKLQNNGEYQQISPILESEINRYKFNPEKNKYIRINLNE